ncbi:MAG: sigma-54 dependent transcriptional regulator [Fuerstiella sp.]
MELMRPKNVRARRRTVQRTVLVAEKETSYSDWLGTALCELGCESMLLRDQQELYSALEENNRATLVLDADFHSNGPLSALGLLQLSGFCPQVILLTDNDSEDLAIRAARMGVQCVINRRSDLGQLKKALAAVLEKPAVRSCSGSPIVGNSSAVKELRDVIRNVAATDAAVMIMGESGTGKELVAQAIHNCSQRAAQEFVPVNMAALPESLFESVLFGHERGAFTGADSRQSGLCHHAHMGTLFLDEIAEMNRDLQPKLLRFLQEYTVQRVGAARSEMVDARIVSATNRSVEQLVRTGILREDLFFRLHVIPIHVPPLRERRDDVPLLAEAFLARSCRQTGRRLSFTSECLEMFYDYSWPGNIRQLENLIERMVIMAKGDVIDAGAFRHECDSLAFSPQNGHQTNGHYNNGHSGSRIPEPKILGDRTLTRMESAERQLIIDALRQHDGNVTAAAEYLGLGQATVYRKIRTLEIPKSRVSGS